MRGSTSGARIAAVICRRELIRFARQPARIAAAIGTPLLLWLLMASGLADAIASDALGDHGHDVTYTAFLLPGMMTLTAVFAAIFASLSTIDDRREGWLQGALVSPAPRWSIALGKVLGGSALAFAQSAVLLAALPLLDLNPSTTGIVLAVTGLVLTSVAMAAMGLAFAWRCDTTSSFHAVMNLLFMPMWLLSGAFFPARRVAMWIDWLVAINPLTWATDAIRGPLLAGGDAEAALPWGPLIMTGLFATLMVAFTVYTVSRRPQTNP